MQMEGYSQLFHASLDAMVRIDKEACILQANERFISFFSTMKRI